MGRIKYIEMIKSTHDKTRVEIEFKTGTYDEERRNEIWCLLFMNQTLVRIMTGTNNLDLFRIRNRFSKRLVDLPEDTNEVLLWRQVKRSGAKALHIFKNSNNNNMRSATLYFEKQEDMINASRFSIYYYDNKLRYADIGRQEVEVVVVENQRVKEYLKPKIYQKRSTKSLGKRRETEDEQEGKCSKHV